MAITSQQKEGKTGLVRAMYLGLPLGSIVACLGIWNFYEEVRDGY